MENIIIRKATIEDLDSVSSIYSKIHTAEEKGQVVIGWKRGVYPEKTTAEEALNRNDLFVEEYNGNIVGTAILNQLQVDIYEKGKWEYNVPDEKVMVMHTLVIDPDIKGRGLGSAFARFYEKYAVENGCPYLRIDTNELNTNARSLYRKLGYKEVGIFPCEFNGLDKINLVLLEKMADQYNQ